MASLLNAMIAVDVEALLDKIEKVQPLESRDFARNVIHAGVWAAACSPGTFGHCYAITALAQAAGCDPWKLMEKPWEWAYRPEEKQEPKP